MAAPSTSSAPTAAGSIVIAYLHNPREKIWGLLLGIDAAGIWLRGVDLRSFDDWLRGHVAGAEQEIAASTTFYPLARVEKILLDEVGGGLPSLEQQCITRTGQSPRALLAPRALQVGEAP
ncbi:MAG TPA: hypothetical protein VFG76_09170 [Candidatus Polarisedimenticolia bacterium]|nr:hypothetical protein [Candidatus Polarisedimenticolia bacterium]